MGSQYQALEERHKTHLFADGRNMKKSFYIPGDIPSKRKT
jgi:predicted amidohydrolase